MTKLKNSPNKKKLEKELSRIFEILDLHSEAIEDGNLIFDDIIRRLEELEK